MKSFPAISVCQQIPGVVDVLVNCCWVAFVNCLKVNQAKKTRFLDPKSDKPELKLPQLMVV